MRWNGTHAWPSSKKLSKPCQEKSSLLQTRNHVSACNADGNSNPEIIWRKKNKNYGIRHLEDLNEINQNISRCQKNTPMKTVSKVIFPSRRFPGEHPKHHPSHLQTFSRRRRCFRPGHPQHQSSQRSGMIFVFTSTCPMSVFSHFVGKWNGVNCTTALAMPGFGQSSASSALPSSALPLGEGLSGIPSQFPTFAT